VGQVIACVAKDGWQLDRLLAALARAEPPPRPPPSLSCPSPSSTWFERGERLTRERVRALARSLSRDLTEKLRGLGRRRPGRKGVEAAVETALQELPPAAREPLDP